MPKLTVNISQALRPGDYRRVPAMKPILLSGGGDTSDDEDGNYDHGGSGGDGDGGGGGGRGDDGGGGGGGGGGGRRQLDLHGNRTFINVDETMAFSWVGRCVRPGVMSLSRESQALFFFCVCE